MAPEGGPPPGAAGETASFLPTGSRPAGAGETASFLPTAEAAATPTAAALGAGADPLAVGGLIAGRYLIEELREGGFGSVYLARSLLEGKRCALKSPRAALLGRPDVLAAFRAEALLWIRLGAHPNVVHAYGVEEFLRLPFVVVELVPDGRSLAELVGQGWELALRAGHDVARGLAHAWAVCGLVHGDLKPQNVLVAADGCAKVTDFGLSVAATQEGPPGDGPLRGTPPYRAPELFAGRPISVASDVYAFGVLLFECATGARPFRDHPTWEGYAFDHTYRAPPDPRELTPAVPEPVASLVARCLAKRPEERPGSFEALAGELARLHEELLGAPPPARAGPDAAQGADGLVNACVAEAALGRLDEAIRSGEEAIARAPEAWAAHDALGAALLAAGRAEEARARFLAAHDLGPGELAPLANLALAEHARGAQAEARGWLARAIAAAEPAVERLEPITPACVDLLPPGEALALLDRIVAANPHAVMAWNNRAVLLRRMGEPERARQSALRAVTSNPAYAKGWTNLANAEALLGRFEAALSSAERALGLDPTLAGAHAARATALVHLDRVPAARRALEEGLRRLPGDPLLRRGLEGLEALEGASGAPAEEAPRAAEGAGTAWAGEPCFFCGLRPPAPGLERVVTLHRPTGTPGAGSRPPSTTVGVPRCGACHAGHLRVRRIALAVCWLGTLAAFGFLVVWSPFPFPWWARVLGVVLAIGLGGCLLGGTLGLPPGQRPEREAFEHEGVVGLKRAGWVPDERPGSDS